MSLPERLLLDGDAVPGGGEDVTAPDSHQLATFVPARPVVQNGGIINEGVQFANETEKKRERERARLHLISGAESDIIATTFQLTC